MTGKDFRDVSAHGVNYKEVFEVTIKVMKIAMDGWKSKIECKLLRHKLCTDVDPQDGLCRGVCPIP